MSETVDVYFSNGRIARLPKDKTFVRTTEVQETDLPLLVNAGNAVVNWRNVCMIRETPEPKDEDDD